MAAYFELKPAAETQFMFNLRAGNDEQKGIDSTKRHAPSDANYDRKTSSSVPYFVLKASNGETLGRSEMYSSTSAMEDGIQSVKTNAPSAPVRDLT